MDLVERLMPPTTDATARRGPRPGQAHLHALGVTAWQDAIVDAARRGARRTARAADARLS